MRTHLRLSALGLGLVLALAAGATPARAGFIANVLSGASSQGGGVFLYTYMVQNAATSTLGVSEFDMVLPTDANLQSIAAPMGFLSLYTQGDSTISFISTSESTDIAPGGVGIFSFTSRDVPGLGSYSLLTFDDSGGFGPGDVISGVTIAPTAVPEPGSLILLGLGLPGAVALAARGRRRLLVNPPGSPI